MDPQYRYPGTRSFERKEADVFFGREGDTQQLWRLLRLEQLVVLYGKSGLGKSSLINAGILPLVDRFNDRLPEEEEEADRLAIEEIRFGAAAFRAAPGRADCFLQPDLARRSQRRRSLPAIDGIRT